MMDFVFEESPWEQVLKNAGDRIAATQLLALLEGEEEYVWEDAFALLNESHTCLDISSLPKTMGTGETAVRLRWVVQLVKNGTLLRDLAIILFNVAMTMPLGYFLREFFHVSLKKAVWSTSASKG